jgi:hypothetical protein
MHSTIAVKAITKVGKRKTYDLQVSKNHNIILFNNIIANNSGKSTIASQVALYLDPTYNLDRCTFTADQFIQAVITAERYTCVVFDEAFGYLNSRQALSKFNRSLIKVMSEMGSRNLFIIIVLPSFFELDKYPALHRSVSLIHVYQRGKFSSYGYSKKKSLYIAGKKFYSYATTPDFIGRFTKHFTLEVDEYKKKKSKFILQDISGKGREFGYRDQRDELVRTLYNNFGLTMEAIGEKTRLTASQVCAIINKTKDVTQ